MSKVVFYGVPLYAHSIQTFPLVRELVDRGEEVVYYSNRKFEEEIKLAGAEFREYLSEYYDDPSDMIWHMHKYMPKVREIIRQELVNLKKINPDYLIHDRNALWAPIIAEKFNLPTVCSLSSIALNRSVKRLHPRMKLLKMYSSRFHLIPQFFYSVSAIRTIINIKKEFIFQGDINPISNAELVLVNTSKEFQPFCDSFEDRFKFIGWIPSTQYRKESTFPWEKISNKKLVYVSLGTTFNRNDKFYRDCFDALKGLECQVVISTGQSKNLNLPTDVPNNFILADWVPQLDILQRADVFITQGGSSSVSESLNFGCPVVVIPQMAEQHIIGYWVEQIKVGKHFEGGKVNASRLRSAVETVMNDPQYRQNSLRIGESFRSSGGVAYGVDEIFKLKETFTATPISSNQSH